MTPTEQTLLQSLTELDAAVKGMAAAGPKPDLQPMFARIDELARQLPPGTDSELLHFLQRKSYEKARLTLLGRPAGIRAGSCGR
jgi:hypothetical protein